jgi:hypothetical protein
MKTAALAEQERLLTRKRELELELESSSNNSTESVIEAKYPFGIPTAAIENATNQNLSLPSSHDDESTQESISIPDTVSESPYQNETTAINVTVNAIESSMDDENSMQEEVSSTPAAESKISLPPVVKEFLDKYIPPSIQLALRNMAIKIYKDTLRLLRLQLRICRALVGQLRQRIDEYKAAKKANTS